MWDQKENQWNLNIRHCCFSEGTKENYKWHSVPTQRDDISEVKTRKSWESMRSAYSTKYTDFRRKQSSLGRTQ